MQDRGEMQGRRETQSSVELQGRQELQYCGKTQVSGKHKGIAGVSRSTVEREEHKEENVDERHDPGCRVGAA